MPLQGSDFNTWRSSALVALLLAGAIAASGCTTDAGEREHPGETAESTAAPAGPAALPPMGVAVREDDGWCAMFAADSTNPLPAGQAVSLVFADSSSLPVLAMVVRQRRKKPCHAEFAQPRWMDYAGYDLRFSGDSAGAAEGSMVAFAFAAAATWEFVRPNAARASFPDRGNMVEVIRCAAHEGEHFTLWTTDASGRRTRAWHEYYDWGAEVDRTCKPGEDGQ